MMDKLTEYGSRLEGMAANIFDDPDEDVADANTNDHDGLFEHPPLPKGQGYQLSFMHHKDPSLHTKPYFLTSQLGAPFPSYHSNPQPRFPARWTLIPKVRPPVESILAPRIRLGPNELGQKIKILDKMNEAGYQEGTDQPMPVSLNLTHQCLGDPYQYEMLKAFLSVNSMVQVLNLNDNELEDITDLRMDHVVKLHLSLNNFVSFIALPASLPMLEELHVKNNFLSTLVGFDSSRFPRLRRVSIDLNPLQHMENIFDEMHSRVPTLEVLTGSDHDLVMDL